jgi:hypothetical protein
MGRGALQLEVVRMKVHIIKVGNNRGDFIRTSFTGRDGDGFRCDG